MSRDKACSYDPSGHRTKPSFLCHMQIVIGHPPILSYKPEQLEAFWVYLASIGIKDVGATIAARPNLLGLDVDKNLRKIVEYLQYVETPTETIIKLLEKSI
jgi:hypothetical protein